MFRLLLALTLVAWFAAPSGVQGEQLVDPGYRLGKVGSGVLVDQLGAKPVQLDRLPGGRIRGPQCFQGVPGIVRHLRDGMR